MGALEDMNRSIAVVCSDKLAAIRRLIDDAGLPDDHPWAWTHNSKIRAILDA